MCKCIDLYVPTGPRQSVVHDPSKMVNHQSASNLPHPANNVSEWSIVLVTIGAILGCVLVAGIACMSLYRYRRSGRFDTNSVRANSLVHGIINVGAMSISTIHSGESHGGSSGGSAMDVGNSGGSAMSFAGSDLGDVRVWIRSDGSGSGTDTDDEGVTTVREDWGFIVPVNKETEDSPKHYADQIDAHEQRAQLETSANYQRKRTVIHGQLGAVSSHVHAAAGADTTRLVP
jgi:hypothetical protein